MTRNKKESPITTLSQALGTERTPYRVETQFGFFDVELRPINLIEFEDLKELERTVQDTETAEFISLVIDMCVARGRNLDARHVRRVLKGHPSIEGLFQILATGVVPQEGEDPKNAVKPTGV